MRALVTGATGLIGSALMAKLPGAVAVSRDPAHARARLGNVEAHRWSAETEPPPDAALRGVTAVFNLAGETVGERWTDERKKRIRNSRVLGTRNLVAGLASMSDKPEVLVSASAAGYYGDRGDEELDELAKPGRDFLASVCAEWEHEAMAAEALGIRVVCVRISLVLSREGGALARMLTPFKLGAGGRLGSGKQWMPWIHIDDVVGLLLHAARTDEIRGPMNAVAPNPVTNAEFTRALGHALHRPTILAVPATALRLAFGEMSVVLLGSQKVHPAVAERSGYAFAYPELERALASALGDARRTASEGPRSGRAEPSH